MPKQKKEAFKNAGAHLNLQENEQTQRLVEEHLRNVQEKRDKFGNKKLSTNMAKKQTSKKSQPSENTDTTTGKLTPMPRGSFPSLPDSDPLFKRGFVIGGRGFNRPRPRKESK